MKPPTGILNRDEAWYWMEMGETVQTADPTKGEEIWCAKDGIVYYRDLADTTWKKSHWNTDPDNFKHCIFRIYPC